MNTATLNRLLPVLLGVALTGTAAAQERHLAMAEDWTEKTYMPVTGSGSAVHDKRTVHFPASAELDLHKRYPEHQSANWYVYDKGIIVKFETNGLRRTALYGTDGIWKQTITYYKNDQIPVETMELVSAKYPGYRLRHGFEVATQQVRSRMIVQIENDSELKELDVLGKKIRLRQTVHTQ